MCCKHLDIASSACKAEDNTVLPRRASGRLNSPMLVWHLNSQDGKCYQNANIITNNSSFKSRIVFQQSHLWGAHTF